MKIISIVNQKGGVGKTNTAINLSASLASINRRVLLIDMDPQGNSSRGLGFDATSINRSIFDILFGRVQIQNAIQTTCVKDLFIIPSKFIISRNMENVDQDYLLKNALEQINSQFDYIILDCPPSLELLTVNCFVASNSIIIPVQCEYFAMNAVTQIFAAIKTIQQDKNPSLEIEGVLLTMFDAKSEVDVQIAYELRNLFKEKTFATRIPRSHAIPESNMKGMPVTVYRPSSGASLSYLSLAKEIESNNNH